MSELQKAARRVVEEWRCDYGSVRMASLMMALEKALSSTPEPEPEFEPEPDAVFFKRSNTSEADAIFYKQFGSAGLKSPSTPWSNRMTFDPPKENVRIELPKEHTQRRSYGLSDKEKIEIACDFFETIEERLRAIALLNMYDTKLRENNK